MKDLENIQPIHFKFGQYIEDGLALLKKDYGNILLATFFTFILSIIPFCGYVAMSNLFQFLKKIKHNEPASPSEIFNFDDFMKYFVPQLIIIAGVLVLYIPIIFMAFMGNGHSPFYFIYLMFFIVIIMYFNLLGFYIPALFSFTSISDLGEAWQISKKMAKGNLLTILGFMIVVGILAELGVFLCFIGIFLTLPFLYTAYYEAYEDAMNQIEK